MDVDIAGTRPCFDPECDGVAEPDQDGDHVYHACPVCGATFGYRRLEQPAQLCAAGINPATAPAATTPLTLQIGVRSADPS